MWRWCLYQSRRWFFSQPSYCSHKHLSSVLWLGTYGYRADEEAAGGEVYVLRGRMLLGAKC
jgi:hypothetical protein